MNNKTGGSYYVINSGCTQHMIDDPRMFTLLNEEVDDQEKVTSRDKCVIFEGQRIGQSVYIYFFQFSNVILVAI